MNCPLWMHGDEERIPLKLTRTCVCMLEWTLYGRTVKVEHLRSLDVANSEEQYAQRRLDARWAAP